MGKRDESMVYETLFHIVDKWDSIYAKAYQDGEYQSLPLNKIKDDKEIAKFVIKTIRDKFYGAI